MTQQSDELKEAVKRFCRTDQAADNLVAYITQQTQEAVKAAKIEQHQKDVEAFKEYAQKVWMCDVLHGGYTIPANDVHKSLKEYEAREDLREDFAKFFEQAQLKANTNKEGQHDE